MDPVNKIGAEIRKARRRNKLSQERLAELLNVTPTHVKHIESGRRRPSVELLFAAAELLNFSIDEMLRAENATDHVPNERVMELLDGCTDREIRLIEDLILAVRKHR